MLKMRVIANLYYIDSETGQAKNLECEDFWVPGLNRPWAKAEFEKHLDARFGCRRWFFVSEPTFEAVDTESNKKTAQSANSERL